MKPECDCEFCFCFYVQTPLSASSGATGSGDRPASASCLIPDGRASEDLAAFYPYLRLNNMFVFEGAVGAVW